jgi:hypothetical protein
VFTPVPARNPKAFSLIDCIAVGVDRMQRSFALMLKQVEACLRSELTDVTTKIVMYEAFVEDKIQAPKRERARAHDLYSSKIRGVSVAPNLEPVECVRFGIQGIGSSSPIQGDYPSRSVLEQWHSR